jgi:hypothetical protein
MPPPPFCVKCYLDLLMCYIIMTIQQLVGLRKQEYHNFWSKTLAQLMDCPLPTHNTQIIMTRNQAYSSIPLLFYLQ